MQERSNSPSPPSPAPRALNSAVQPVDPGERHELLATFVAAGEEDRRRIAAGIHDDSIQVIAALGMRLQMLRRTLSDPEQLAFLTEAEDAVQMSISRLRHLVVELHPPGLEQEGLSVALSIALDAVDDATAAYRFDDRLSAPPGTEASAILFRIAQEALENVRAHACASTVAVTLLERDGGLAVRIADDGCGFEPELSAPGSTCPGFAAMRARAELGCGSLHVESAPGRGTTVEAWLPHVTGAVRGREQA
jgi:signal transduction histidine kinase